MKGTSNQDYYWTYLYDIVLYDLPIIHGTTLNVGDKIKTKTKCQNYFSRLAIEVQVI